MLIYFKGMERELYDWVNCYLVILKLNYGRVLYLRKFFLLNIDWFRLLMI